MSLRLADLKGLNVALLGFGREGQASLQALKRRLPGQRISVLPNQTLAPAQALANDHLVEWIDGAASFEKLNQFDVIIKSPGISPYLAPLNELSRPRLTSGSALWFAEPESTTTVCITGTKGKSTTAALTAHLLASRRSSVALAGNIGRPLLDLLDQPAADFTVIELSSYQTADFAGAPAIACCLNLYPEHLPWHQTEARYYTDKLKIFEHAKRCLINAEQPRLRDATRHFANIEGLLDIPDERFAHSPLLGAHNRLNVRAALSLVAAAGVDWPLTLDALQQFQPLPHRLTSLGMRAGVRVVDDSIATTPHATLAALACFERARVVVLVGGFDRGLDWHDFAIDVALNPPKAVVISGANGAAIALALHEARVPCLIEHAGSFDAAVSLAVKTCADGDVLLLSPGAPSFDAFTDFQQRGARFAELTGFKMGALR